MSGLPTGNSHRPVTMLLLGCDMLELLQTLKDTFPEKLRQVEMRIGIHTGFLCGGVFGGSTKFKYGGFYYFEIVSC